MDKNGSGVGCERRAQAVDITEMEISRAGDVVDVRFEGKCAVEGDA